MKILCLDDEELALKMLQMAVEKARPWMRPKRAAVTLRFWIST